MHNVRIILIVVSTALVLYSPLVYVQSILAGESKPHRTTRVVLFVISALTFVTIAFEGGQTGFWIALASAVQSIGVLGLALKYGVGGWSKIDIACLLLAAVAILAWQLSKDPFVGLELSIVADFVGIIPAIIKTWRQPDTETPWFYALDGLGAFLVIGAITQWSLSQLMFPVYLTLVNGLLAGLAFRRPSAALDGNSVAAE